MRTSRPLPFLLAVLLFAGQATPLVAAPPAQQSEPTNAAEAAAKKQAQEAAVNEKYERLVAGLPPEQQAWERVLQEQLGSFYLPLHKQDRIAGRSNAWDFVKDDPALPRVLLIGDSVSRGYTQAARRALAGKANVHRAPANCGPTASGLKNLDVWLGDGRWDLIHFNFGIHDRGTPLADYTGRLEKLVERMKKTGARLVWATTTPIPDVAATGQTAASIVERNTAAATVMERRGVAVDDLFGFITPHLAEVQPPNDVHFTAKGYDLLGGQVAASILEHLEAADPPAAEPAPASDVRVAVFDVDATPPLGAAMAYGPVVRVADLQLRSRGIVLLGAGEPIVLCSVDWLGIGNAAHDAFRTALAGAAGTTPGRVAVHVIHQHDAPHADFTAEKILRDMGVRSHPRFDGDFHREVIARTAAAVATTLPKARAATHVGFGRGTVEQVASNRRLLDADGKFVAWRASATRDPQVAAWPEGTIDPEVAALAFFAGEEPLAVVTSYACHPMSYYRTGIPGPDFPGIARLIRSQDLPSALHLHFTGAGGNVAAGKYNDGGHANRVPLALRLAAGMRAAYAVAAQDRRPLTVADVGWGSVPVTLAARAELDRDQLAAAIQAKPDRGTFSPIDALAFATRAAERHVIDVTCLRVGRARMLHMPGELFVEYQLAARGMRPDLDVFMAAYGDYGPGYIGTSVAYPQGGYETQVTSSFVGPDAEEPLMAAMRQLLDAPQ